MAKASAFLYPSTCLSCEDEGHDEIDLCIRCYENLPWIKYVCKRCALPLEKADSAVCGSCSKRKIYFDHSFAPLLYESFVRDSIHQFKFNSKLNHGKLLASLLTKQILQRKIAIPDILVPVPLHRNRIRKRGFNQALEITRLLNKQLNCIINFKDVRRVKSTHAQMDLPAAKRHKNVKGAFAMQSSHSSFKNKHVAIIDDVMTTGSTVNEVAKCLKKAEAKRVDVWCIARVP